MGIYWSARVGISYRALGKERVEGIVWMWIGSHAEYDRLLKWPEPIGAGQPDYPPEIRKSTRLLFPQAGCLSSTFEKKRLRKEGNQLDSKK